MSERLIDSVGEAVQASGGINQFQQQMDSLKQLDGKTLEERQKILPGYNNMINDVNYIWNNPGKVDETMNAIRNSPDLDRDVSLTLTMNDGAYIGGNKIAGTDPTVIRLIASGIVNGPDESKFFSSRSAAEGYSSQEYERLTKKSLSGQLSFTTFQNGLKEKKLTPVKSN
ncbi:Uncharacterised protein [uncultured archaeon]|nr:Uncharacterised protein [uncultured archaeon]